MLLDRLRDLPRRRRRGARRHRRPRAAADREHHRRQHQRDLRPARRGRPHDHRRGGRRDRALPARAAGRALEDLRAGDVASAGARAVRGASCAPAPGCAPRPSSTPPARRARCASWTTRLRGHRERVGGAASTASRCWRAASRPHARQLHPLRRGGARGGAACPPDVAVQDLAAPGDRRTGPARSARCSCEFAGAASTSPSSSRGRSRPPLAVPLLPRRRRPRRLGAGDRGAARSGRRHARAPDHRHLSRGHPDVRRPIAPPA